MEVGASVDLSPIDDANVRPVAQYLHANLNPRVPVAAWESAMSEDWGDAPPNHGFFLTSGGVIVGACLAFYSTREVDGATEPICNLGALCVDPDYRIHVVRLLRALLGQQSYTFTDLSPSGNVVALNERLGFEYLDTTTALVANVPLPHRAGRTRVITRHDEIAARLKDHDLRIFRDHRGAGAAHHVLLVDGLDLCHVVFRKDRRKRLRLFASILYVSDREVFARASGALFAHLLLHDGAIATLAELRIVGARPPRSILLGTPRQKMYKSARLGAERIDYLYSELTSLAW